MNRCKAERVPIAFARKLQRTNTESEITQVFCYKQLAVFFEMFKSLNTASTASSWLVAVLQHALPRGIEKYGARTAFAMGDPGLMRQSASIGDFSQHLDTV